MTLRAWHFAVRRRGTNRLVGHAMLCPSVRYASTRFFGMGQLLRGFADLSQWRAIDRELAAGWDQGNVPATAVVTVALLARDLSAAHTLQFVTPIPIEAPSVGSAQVLDDYLKRQEGW